MLGKSAFSARWLRPPSLLIAVLTILFLVTSPRAAGDISADQVLGQALFTLNAANFVDGAGFNFSSDPQIAQFTEPDGIAVDTNATPQHLYIADAQNSRILGWNNADSFANGQAADLVIGQVDMFHNATATTQSGLSTPIGVAVDASGNLYIADLGNN